MTIQLHGEEQYGKTDSMCIAGGKHGRTSSFRGESEAFEDALTWMAAKTGQDDHFLVLTDSRQSLVTRLQLGKGSYELISVLFE